MRFISRVVESSQKGAVWKETPLAQNFIVLSVYQEK